MADFLLIAPSGFQLVDLDTLLSNTSYPIDFFIQVSETGVDISEVNDLFRQLGWLDETREICQLKYISETGQLWYSLC